MMNITQNFQSMDTDWPMETTYSSYESTTMLDTTYQSGKDDVFTWIYCVLRVMEIMAGVGGNLLVILVISRYRYLHTLSNILVINLAVADLLVSTSGVFAVTLDLYPHPVSDSGFFIQFICAVKSCLQSGGIMGNAALVLSIAFDRFLSFKASAFYSTINRKKNVQ